MRIHDIGEAHHELDYRCFALLPCAMLANVVLVVVRVFASGPVQVELVAGSQVPDDLSGARYVWLLLMQGHMRLLRAPPAAADPLAWLAPLTLRGGGPPFVTPSIGWALFLAVSGDQVEDCSPDIRSTCRCCLREARMANATRRAGDAVAPLRGYGAAVNAEIARGFRSAGRLAHAGRESRCSEL